MSGGQQRLQWNPCPLPQRTDKMTAAYSPVLVQKLQNFYLPCGRGPHRPGGVHTQHAKFLTGGIGSRRQQPGLPVGKSLGKVLPCGRISPANAGQGP